MHITYVWFPESRGPGFVNSVTLNTPHIPRIGDDIAFNMWVSRTEQAKHIGKVERVEWSYQNEHLEPSLIISIS